MLNVVKYPIRYLFISLDHHVFSWKKQFWLVSLQSVSTYNLWIPKKWLNTYVGCRKSQCWYCSNIRKVLWLAVSLMQYWHDRYRLCIYQKTLPILVLLLCTGQYALFKWLAPCQKDIHVPQQVSSCSVDGGDCIRWRRECPLRKRVTVSGYIITYQLQLIYIASKL